MAFGISLKNRVYERRFLGLCIVLLIAFIIFSRYANQAGFIPRNDYESLQRECDNRTEEMNLVNQELSVRIERIEEELRSTAAERDSLKQDKTQLLFMVDKLEQQSGKCSAPGRENSLSTRVARSWMVRIAELRNAPVHDDASARNEYSKEVDEVVRGLKEDFAEDSFIMGLGYSKTSSRAINDIRRAQKTLEDIAQHLSTYYSPDAD